MLFQGERIALELEDGSVLYFDYSPAWGGYYVLDAKASPAQVFKAGREAVKYAYYSVKDEDLKMFFAVSDGEQEVNKPLMVAVGLFKSGVARSSSNWCTIPGGLIVSAKSV